MAFRNQTNDPGDGVCSDSNNRLHRSLAAIFSKYDKEFPESDVINLQDLSISDDRGFLNRLPKEQQMWNSNLAKSSPLGLQEGQDLDVPSKDLSTTALDIFLEEVISEEYHQGNITEVDVSFQEEDSEDFNDDTASITSGVVSKESDDVLIVEENDEESSSDQERPKRVVDRPLLCVEESLDKMEKVEVWLSSRRKRKAVSEDDSNLINKVSQSNVTEKCDKEVYASPVKELVNDNVLTKEKGQVQGNIKTPNTEKRTPKRKLVMHADSAKLVIKMSAVGSPVREGATFTSSTDLVPQTSGGLIESWKTSILKKFNQEDPKSNIVGLPRKQCSSHSSLFQVAHPYSNNDSDSCTCSRSAEVSSTSQFTNAYGREQDTMESTKETSVHSLSQEYLQELNKNFYERKKGLSGIDSLNSNGATSSTEEDNATTKEHKVIKENLQTSVIKRNLKSMKQCMSSQCSLSSISLLMNSEINTEEQQVKPLNLFHGKLQNKDVTKAVVSEKSCKVLNHSSEDVRVESALNDSHVPCISPSYESTVTPLIETSLEDLSSSFIPCHSSTMINCPTLAALHNHTLDAEDSKVKGKQTKHKVKRKHDLTKDLQSQGDGAKKAIRDSKKENLTSAQGNKSYDCPIKPLLNKVDKSNTSDGHFVNKKDLKPVCIDKESKLPSSKSEPMKCNKVFCFDCCHS